MHPRYVKCKIVKKDGQNVKLDVQVKGTHQPLPKNVRQRSECCYFIRYFVLHRMSMGRAHDVYFFHHSFAEKGRCVFSTRVRMNVKTIRGEHRRQG